MRANKHSIRLNKRVLILLCALLALIILLGVAYRLAHTWEISNSQVAASPDAVIFPENDQAFIQVGGQEYVLKDGLETVLLMGVDKFQADAAATETYRNDQQADYLTVLIVDHEAEICTPLQLNRDTMADIPVLGVGGKPAGSTYAQLALAHTYGDGKEMSCRNTVDAVSQYLYGMEIDHYVSLTMDAIPVLNDAVGGVTVKIEDDFSAVDPTLVKGETVTLQGNQALTFVRARQGMLDSSNLERMGRQRLFFGALYAQLSELLQEDSSVFTDLLTEISPYMVSDCSLEEWVTLLDAVGSYDMEEIQTVSGESVQGDPYMEFYTDEDALQQQLIDLLYEPVEE